jgi:hypothetical protein
VRGSVSEEERTFPSTATVNVCQRTKSLRDSPLRGGALMIAFATGESINSGEAREPQNRYDGSTHIFFDR